MRKWLAPAGLVVLLIGTGGLFTTVDLGRADSFASVASFLLALAVAGGTVIAGLRRAPRHPAHQPAKAGQGDRIAYHSGVVIQGDGSTNTITINGHRNWFRRLFGP